MPHLCIHCNNHYEDGARETLHGCSCGSKFFFYVTAEKLAKIQTSAQPAVPLSTEEKQQIEEDVRDIIGEDVEESAPVVLDFESVKVLKPGKYVLDLHNLFNQDRPLVYTLEEGKYVIDLASQIGPKRTNRTRETV